MLKVLSMLIITLSCTLYAQDALYGTVEGEVTSGGEPVNGVTLSFTSPIFSRTITVDGAFELTNLPETTYRVEVVAAGFRELTQEVRVVKGETTRLDLELELAQVSLSEVVVAPSTFSLLAKPVAGGSYLDRETIRNTPKFGDDLYRALGSIPGVSSNDFSASFNVRGGDYREVLVTLDGMELINPFHLKDFVGVFSYIDPETLQGLTLNTGGYDARFGNAMSAVMEMNTLTPDRRRSSASVSLGNVSFRTEGTFADGLGAYLFSGRRGYLDILLSFTDDDDEEEQEEQDITYYDSYGKLSYILGDRHKLTGSYLLAHDDFLEDEVEDGLVELTNSDYDDIYLWATLQSEWSPRLSSTTVAYYGTLDQNRMAISEEEFEQYDFSDLRELEYTGFKQDWSFELNDDHFLRFGFDVRSVDAVYDYSGDFFSPEPIGVPESASINVALEPSGEEYSAYLTDRFRIGERWLFELGLRYDRQTILEDNQVSPRFNAAYQLDDDSTLRFAYGVYHQAERAHDLQVADGVDAFSPPEKSTHYLLGYERRFDRGLEFRVEAYYKELEDLRVRYANLTTSLSRFGGPGPDRIALPVETGEATGVEVTLKQDRGGKLSWFANYAWSQAEDDFGGITVPRPFDQEHTVNVSVNYRPGRKWNFNAAWTYRSGWPTTPFSLAETVDENGNPDFEIQPGQIFSDNFPAYHRLDFRASRTVFKSDRRSFELFLDVFNLYNRENVRGFEEFEIVLDDAGQPTIQNEQEDWLPILPTFGLTWRF